MHAGLAGVVHTYTYTCTHICLYVDMCTRTHTHVDVHIHIHMYTYTRTKMCSKIAQIARIQNWHEISPKMFQNKFDRGPKLLNWSKIKVQYIIAQRERVGVVKNDGGQRTGYRTERERERETTTGDHNGRPQRETTGYAFERLVAVS